MPQRHQRPQAAHQHRADAEVADLLRPDETGDVLGGQPRRGLRELGVAGQRGRDIERDGDVPGEHRTGEHHDADIEADDVADADQRG